MLFRSDPVVGTKTWFEDGKIVQQELKYSEVYKQPTAWVSLTDEELEPLCDEWRIIFGSWTYDFARAIEAALRSKNT